MLCLEQQSPCHCPASDFKEIEARYQASKKRLHAAQQEKLESTVDFLAAREALRLRMKEIWPGQSE